MEKKTIALGVSLIIALLAVSIGSYTMLTVIEMQSSLDAKLDVMRKVVENTYGVNMDVILGAIEEKSLTIYTAYFLDQTVEWTRKFQQKYPFISVEVFRGTDAEISERFRTEQNARKYSADIFSITGPDGIIRAANDGLLMNYTPSEDPLWPAAYKVVPGCAYAWSIHPYCVAWNTNLVNETEAAAFRASWDAVTDPKWKGKCAILAPQGGTAVQYIGHYMILHEFGRQFEEKLAALEPTIFKSAGPLNQGLVAGEYALAIWTYEGGLHQAYEKGAPVAWAHPNKTLVLPFHQAIVATAPHPNAAKLWMEWSLSLEGQTAMHAVCRDLPARKDVTDTRLAVKAPWWQPVTQPYVVPDWIKYGEEWNATKTLFNEIFHYAG